MDKKLIKILGIGIIIFSIVFSAYTYNSDGGKSYMFMGLLATILGLFLTLLGSKKQS